MTKMTTPEDKPDWGWIWFTLFLMGIATVVPLAVTFHWTWFTVSGVK
jgi:hypothetical protein